MLSSAIILIGLLPVLFVSTYLTMMNEEHAISDVSLVYNVVSRQKHTWLHG